MLRIQSFGIWEKTGVEGKTFDTLNPANGKVLASIAEANSEDVNNAGSAARKAFEHGPWS